ncbi:glucuronoxylan 4-O-methyltransferase 1-like [Hibiscus syriacus]|uniref:Glucuronoxylan 4-O-methyltransferase 1-like n=1 Tax=Hibiscus syriacus TaxID=106335 RepID=A0A6A3CSA4_HIBSY|nr:glucuronoxylan 4-O-methyltransferase 1-like [Hibiscus syriacus]
MAESEFDQSILLSMSKSPGQNGRPSSMILKASPYKSKSVIPAHLVAEAISTLQGLDLRWSGPITPTEMQYVEQYIVAKYPQYCTGVVEDGEKMLDVDNLSNSEESFETVVDNKRKSPRVVSSRECFSSSSISGMVDIDNTRLEPSRLFDILSRKTSFQGNFVSIPEIQAQNRALKHCGLSEDEYLVLFMPKYKDAMVLIGESYPFFKGNYYLTIIGEESDYIREFAGQRESKVISAPETWLDLRIKGSQLSQNFRRKCKHTPKGLFSYPADVNGTTRHSLHWISEAHRNSWHVLLDATRLVLREGQRLPLALHRPDFVLCTGDNTHAQHSKITCLLVRKRSFDTTSCAP